MANGEVINQDGKMLMSSESDSVEAVICIPEGFVASYESGKISSASSSGEHLWDKKLQKITAISDGAHGNKNHIFIGSVVDWVVKLSVFLLKTEEYLLK